MRDIKRLAKVPPAWLVVIFLMVLPSLYSWLNIIGFWNPYDNTSNLRVCMVNEDAGAYDENLGQLNMGDQIADQLRDNDQLDWAFVDREEAMREVSAGEAYAAFVVPEDFSADVATLASGDFQQPQLLYYVNEKTGPVAPKITDTGANTLDTTINETFFSTVSGAVADALDDFLAASGTKLDAARSGAAGRVGNARADIAEARAAFAELATTSSSAADEALSAKDTLDSARSSLAALSTTFENVASLSESANTELGKLTASTGTALDEGSASLAQTSASAALALGNASAKIGAAEGTVSAALERGRAVVQENEQVISQLRELKQYTQTSEADEAIERIVAPVEQVDAELTRVMDNLGTQATDLSTTAKATADASSAIDAAVRTSLGNVDAYRTFLTNNTVPTLSEGIGRTASLSGDLGMAIARQQSLVDEASGALDGLHGRMAVYDVRQRRAQTELLQNSHADCFIVVIAVIGILYLVPRVVVVYIGVFKGLGLASVQRRVLSAAQVPHEVQLTLFLVTPEKRGAHFFLRHIKQRFTAVDSAEKGDLLKGAAFVERYAAVIEQIAVAHAVHAAVVVEELNMPLQLGTLHKCRAQAFRHRALVGRERVGIISVYGRELRFIQRIGQVADGHGVALKINIQLFREKCERTQADAVAILERSHGIVVQAIAHSAGNADVASRSGSHPENIMVAPLKIKRMVGSEQIKNTVGGVAAVKDIADNVQAVYRQPLDQRRERNHKIIRAKPNYRVQDTAVIAHLVIVLVLLGMEQLVYDISVLLGHRLAHLGARVFTGQHARDFQHPLQCNAVPFRVGLAFLLEKAQLFNGIINQRANFFDGGFIERIAVKPLHLFMDHA